MRTEGVTSIEPSLFRAIELTPVTKKKSDLKPHCMEYFFLPTFPRFGPEILDNRYGFVGA